MNGFEFAGNQSVISTINKMILSRTLPHAILIEGEEGCGKRTLAGYIAKSAVCTGTVPLCGECANCRATNSPDIIHVTSGGKKSIQVDDIREIRQRASVFPHQSPKQVFVIERADTMTPQAQNALLKILEEPPEFVIFILIAESGLSLLPTILSRCMRFTLKPPEINQAADYLLRKTGKDREAVERAATDAGGNIGKALVLLSGAKESQTVEDAKAIIEALKSGTSLDLLRLCHPYEQDRGKALELLKALESQLLNLLTQKHKNGNELQLTASALVKLIEITRDTAEKLRQNVNICLALTNLCACFKQSAAL
ncbi:MAG TPA: DNA polymerase III subunit delta' [Clostridiales bacterium]|nr:DNA polymerase III subunit delta' [Clostridiales bacterium]